MAKRKNFCKRKRFKNLKIKKWKKELKLIFDYKFILINSNLSYLCIIGMVKFSLPEMLTALYNIVRFYNFCQISDIWCLKMYKIICLK